MKSDKACKILASFLFGAIFCFAVDSVRAIGFAGSNEFLLVWSACHLFAWTRAAKYVYAISAVELFLVAWFAPFIVFASDARPGQVESWSTEAKVLFSFCIVLFCLVSAGKFLDENKRRFSSPV